MMLKEDVITSSPLTGGALLWKKSLKSSLRYLVGIRSGTLLPLNFSHESKGSD